MSPSSMSNLNRFWLLVSCMMITVMPHAALASSVTVKQLTDHATPQTYQMMEWQIDLDTLYDNPFDPDIVKVDAHFQTPSGQRVVMPAFYLQPYDLKLKGDNETLTSKGQGQWRLRFSPREAGHYTFHITVKDQQTTIESQTQTFTAKDSKHPGIIRVSKSNPKAFVYENNEPYIPMGLNLCSPPGSRKDGPPQRVFFYDQWFKNMKQNGMNFGRLWMAPVYNILCLWRKPGQVDQEAAARIDYIMQQAQANDIAMMMCIDVHLHLQSNRYFWKTNPMKKSNGGPITWPTQFWENQEAIRLFKNRLRYVVARWGYSPSVFAWEFWNEVNLTDQSAKYEQQITDWHALMADYIRQIDPYQHMVTTSTAHAKGPAHKLDALDRLDFVQTHFYGNNNSVKYVRDLSKWMPTQFGNKPHLFGEFGPATKLGKAEQDTDGVNVKNMIWAGMFVDTPATPMAWWWSGYIAGNNLWRHYGPLSRFMDNVPVASGPHQSLTDYQLQYAQPVTNPSPLTMHVSGTRMLWENSKPNTPTALNIKENGVVLGAESLSQMLHGVKAHRSWHNPLTINVDYKQAGTFSVIVSGASKAGPMKLQIFVDGQKQLEEEITREDVAQPKTFTVDVPAGQRQIKVINAGRDWLNVSYQLTGPLLTDQPNVDVMGNLYPHATPGQSAMIGWLHNREAIWTNVVDGKAIPDVAATQLQLKDLPKGQYALQWWDTTSGQVLSSKSITVTQPQTVLDVPAFTTDIAFKMIKQ